MLISGKGHASPIRELFSLLHGPRRKGRKFALLLGFFDGSSTHQASKVWTLCGLLGEEEAFQYLDEQWTAILGKKEWRSRISEFHMTDCVNGTDEFECWSYADRLALFGDLTTALSQSNVLAIGSIVIAEDLLRLEPDDLALLQSQRLGSPHDLMLQYIFQTVIRYTRAASLTEDVGLMFDEEPPDIAVQYHEICNFYRNNPGLRHILTGIAFGSSKKFTPLQAADMLAYCTYRLELEKRFPSDAEPWFPVTPTLRRLLKDIAADGGGYDLEALRKLVRVVKEDEFFSLPEL